MNQDLLRIAQQAIGQAHAEWLKDDDALWMAVGAINREAREQGLAGDELTPEFNAAAQTIVKEVLH